MPIPKPRWTSRQRHPVQAAAHRLLQPARPAPDPQRRPSAGSPAERSPPGDGPGPGAVGTPSKGRFSGLPPRGPGWPPQPYLSRTPQSPRAAAANMAPSRRQR